MWTYMAKRIKPKKMNTHRFLYYNIAHSGNGEDASYIDLARDLSAVNRRLYRQGMNYSISNISVHDSQGDARVLVSTAPNTWATHEAWTMAFEGWKRQRAQTLQDMPGASTPRWSDFKVYLNAEHVVDSDWPGVRDDEENVALGTGANSSGEWNYSDMGFFMAGTRYDNHAIGLMGAHGIGSSITTETTPHDSSYDGYISCLEGLQEIRRKPVDTGDVDAAFDDAVFAGMTLNSGPSIEDTLLTIEAEGDNPPYSLEFLGNTDNPAGDTGAWPIRECHIESTYSPMAMMGPIPNVPCGLLQIETTSGGDNTIGLLIELTPGDYKGVHASPMGN